MGEAKRGPICGRNTWRRAIAVALGAVALTVVGASPAAASGIGERITEWPVATSLAAALIFGVLAIVFASLSRAVRDPRPPADSPAPTATANSTDAPAAGRGPLDRRSGGEVEAYRRPGARPKEAESTPSATAGRESRGDESARTPSDADRAHEASAEPTSRSAAGRPPEDPRPRATDADPLYPLATCRQFATGLGDEVLDRALKLFQPLGQIGRLDSVQLAEMLDARPASLGGLLTTPLSRRADALGLPLPYVIDRVPGTRRRVWRDHADIAGRMSAALREEIALRERAGERQDSGDASARGESRSDSMARRG